jgi:hypothetical protein
MPTYWTDSQWMVRGQGVDTLDKKYFIAKNCVHEDDDGQWTWERLGGHERFSSCHGLRPREVAEEVRSR